MELLTWLVDLFLHFDEYLGPVIQDYGGWVYGLLFLIIFCETGLVVTPILPGDSLLFAVGAFAARDMMSLPLLLGLLTLAAILGDSTNYAIGYRLGPRMLAMKRWRPVKPEHLAYTREFFEKYGGKTIVIARFVPIIRTLAPFVAGLGSMAYRRFMVYNIAGGVAWVFLCTLAGYLFGNIPFIQKNFEFVVIAIVAVSLIPAIWEYRRARAHRRNAVQDEAQLAAEDVKVE